jgi:hypothetical protein
MFYNKILRVWVVDLLDYFLISAIIGSFAASYLKNYFSEKVAMERLKNSIINESGSLVRKEPILESKKSKIKRIYKFALENRGGQLEEFQADYENEAFKLAQQIKGLVERLAAFLKQRELKGIAKIFFKNGRLALELILHKFSINIAYELLTKELSTQVIVLTVTAGGAAGFTIAWFAVGFTLFTPPLLLVTFLLRSVTQKFISQKEYLNFKKMVEKILEDEDLKETLRAVFIEGEVPTPILGILEIKPLDFDKNSVLNYDFNLKSGEDFEEFIKARIKEELGLIENPSEIQLKEIIQRKVKRKLKGKTVFFREFIDEIQGADLLDLDIIDAEILEKPIGINLDNEL